MNKYLVEIFWSDDDAGYPVNLFLSHSRKLERLHELLSRSYAPELAVIHKYGEARHFGMDAEIQRPWKAICGEGLYLNQAFAELPSYHPWPGFRYPCRNDDDFHLGGTCV